MEGDFIEAFLLWNENGPSDSVAQWVQRQGLTVTPLQAGLLISGTQDKFERAFVIDLANTEPPFELPVPQDLQEHVTSIGVRKRREPHL